MLINRDPGGHPIKGYWPLDVMGPYTQPSVSVLDAETMLELKLALKPESAENEAENLGLEKRPTDLDSTTDARASLVCTWIRLRETVVLEAVQFDWKQNEVSTTESEALIPEAFEIAHRILFKTSV